MRPLTIFKIIAGVGATVILGAVGSGVWERLLAPGLDWLFRVIVAAISWVSLNYKDGIYHSAALGFHETYSFRAFALIGLVLALFCFFAIYKYHERVRQRIATIEGTHKKWFQWAALIGVLAFNLIVLFGIQRHEAVNQTTTYVLRSLDILRPHIGDHEYNMKLSAFYQVRSAEDFYEVNKALEASAVKYGVRLPDFKPL